MSSAFVVAVFVVVFIVLIVVVIVVAVVVVHTTTCGGSGGRRQSRVKAGLAKTAAHVDHKKGAALRPEAPRHCVSQVQHALVSHRQAQCVDPPWPTSPPLSLSLTHIYTYTHSVPVQR